MTCQFHKFNVYIFINIYLKDDIYIVGEIKVLCVDTDQLYNKHFEKVMRTKLSYYISWIANDENISFANEKYMLLVNVRTRIPDDVAETLHYYKHQGKILLIHIYLRYVF